MQTNSQLIHHNRVIMPDQVLRELNLREGDTVVFVCDQAGVHLRKAPPIDSLFTEALQGTLSEWDSAAADDEAYADL
ncbi:MAG: AbrB family transcriptional regulator [Methylococcaceae bacterium]|nr:AbrB family transcriptional regulator [Methylococcaceae bacterium]